MLIDAYKPPPPANAMVEFRFEVEPYQGLRQQMVHNQRDKLNFKSSSLPARIGLGLSLAYSPGSAQACQKEKPLLCNKFEV